MDKDIIEKVRIDKYLWAIRVFKTRSLASAACETGKVKWNGSSVKASKQVNIGEEYNINTPARKWIVKVSEVTSQRRGFADALKFYIDLTPEEDKVQKQVASSFYTGKRLSKVGRPTKRGRRDLDDFLDN